MEINLKKLFKGYYIDSEIYKAPLFEKTGIRLYMNENMFGPTDKYKEILTNINKDDLYQYENGGNTSLVEKIAEKSLVDKDQVIVTSGSSMALFQIFFSLLQANDVVLLPNPGWSYYKGITSLMGAKYIKYSLQYNEAEYYFNINSMILDVKKYNPKIVIITSPNMPTGNKMNIKDIQEIVSNTTNGIVVLDEAYFGFENDNTEEIESLLENNNLLITRTFSKFFGLANARIGYILGNKQLINLLKKSSDLFGISGISQKMAIEALNDDEYYNKMKEKICDIRDEFIKKVNKETKFTAYKSQSNFVLINTKNVSSSFIVDNLKKHNYLVRDCITYNLTNHIRITVGKKEYMNEIFDILKKNSL